MDIPATTAHLLVIDDSPVMRTGLRSVLEAAGYRVSVAGPPSALAVVTDLGPQLIVQHLHGVGQDKAGWDILTLLHLNQDLARIPVLLCTADVATVNGSALAQTLDRLGIRVLLTPFDRPMLLTAVAEILTAQALLDQAREVP